MKWSAVITACGTSLLLLALTTQAADATQAGYLTRADSPSRAAGLKAQVDAYRAQHESAIVARLDELARFKSVAADPAAIAAAADAKRTVIFYAHYDGQPVTPSQWSSDPFIPLMRSGPINGSEHEIDWKNAQGAFDPEWRLFARAVSDDKASIAAFLTAFDALKAAHKSPSVNIKVLWEGEEEAGSPHLVEIVDTCAALLAELHW